MKIIAKAEDWLVSMSSEELNNVVGIANTYSDKAIQPHIGLELDFHALYQDSKAIVRMHPEMSEILKQTKELKSLTYKVHSTLNKF